MTSNPGAFCRDPQRRRDARARRRNGIDSVEVNDDRLTLVAYLFGRAPEGVTTSNVQITGGARIRNIKAVEIRLRSVDEQDNDDSIEIVVDKPGDLSTYTLRLIEVDENGEPTATPLAGFDPRYAEAQFTFDIGTWSDFDCEQTPVCPHQELPAPEINYLAKDYASFRQLILDRLAVSMPSWQEQHAPDLGIALVEILAYVGDYLSYFQDAVATEAYLDTARQRISVRRHVRLVDYAMHEGCNARAWLCISTAKEDILLDPRTTYFVAGLGDEASGPDAVLSPFDVAGKAAGQLAVFKPMATTPIRLHAAHNEILFYTWGDRLCWLSAGATSAVLLDGWQDAPPADAPAGPPAKVRSPRKRSAKSVAVSQATAQGPLSPPAEPDWPAPRGRRLQLQPGDILLFEEVKGSVSSAPEADPTHRHLVQLTSVKQTLDPLYDQCIVEIEWAAEDALPFALCLSTIDLAPECAHGIARGNIILADHGSWTGNGSWIDSEELGIVPPAAFVPSSDVPIRPAPVRVRGERFRPKLLRAPLTFCQPAEKPTAAAGALVQDPRLAIPQIDVRSIPPMPDGSGPLFHFAELKNPLALATALANPDNASARKQALRGHISRATWGLIEQLRTADADEQKTLKMALSDELQPLVRSWTPQRDLLASHGRDFHFVVETDDSGYAHLRFGDGELGRAPEAGELFAATYRVGNGPSGNVGAETITGIVVAPGGPQGASLTSRNPFAASGGTDPESTAQVKLIAPNAFQNNLQRAIIAEDYAKLAEQHPKVQRAAATLQWMGTRYEAHVAIDPLDTECIDQQFLRQIRAYLHRYRRVGHDVIVVPPQYVALDIAMTVDILPGYSRGHVGTALRDVFSNRALSGGKRGFFDPDNLSFGDAIRASGLVAAAQAVTGVESVAVTRLERLFAGENQELENGVLPIGPLEVARLDNDPAFPENGRFVLTLRGGR